MRGGGLQFFVVIPRNWREALATLAYHYHFQPSELWRMTIREIEFWLEQLPKVVPHG